MLVAAPGWRSVCISDVLGPERGFHAFCALPAQKWASPSLKPASFCSGMCYAGDPPLKAELRGAPGQRVRCSANSIKTMKLLSALFCVPLVSHAAAAATRVTFDDLSPGPAGSYIAIPNGYGGLQWSGFGVLNGTLTSPPSGYQYGIVSPDNVAFNYDEFDRTA